MSKIIRRPITQERREQWHQWNLTPATLQRVARLTVEAERRAAPAVSPGVTETVVSNT